MERDLEILVSDALVLADSYEMQQYLADPDEGRRYELEYRFLNFTTDRRLYDQIRFLDSDGLEVVRINYNEGQPKVVPANQLQNKGDRYYFKETMNQGEREIYISPLDLNKENGLIERPLKPMLRIALPLDDAAGKRRGVLVLNYLAQKMLHRFTSQLSEARLRRYSMVNEQGFWLHHPNPEREWGFMFDHGDSFARENSHAWKQIGDQEWGRAESEGELFVFRRLKPQAIIKGSMENPMVTPFVSSGEARPLKQSWVLLSRFGPDDLNYSLAQALENRTLLTAFVGILLLTAYGIWQTAQARTSREIAESYLRILFVGVEQSPAGVIITDTEGIAEYINLRFSEISGYGAKEMIGENPRKLKSGETAPEEYKNLWDTISSGRTWRGVFHNRRKDGSYYWTEGQISPIVDASGKITHFIGIQEDISEKRELKKKLRILSHSDPLTGAYNRRQFFSVADAEVARCRRFNHALSVIIMDLDNFKAINEKYGHPAGDTVLRAFVETITPFLRASDILCRFGGEEFVATLPETTMLDAISLAERLRHKVSETPALHAGLEISMTVSIGCATWNRDEPNLEAAIQRADSALHLAKECGRNRVMSK
ncbi:sensor domain-containing diguanylate cyclase [Magnetospira sp. QH-2]|uniref:sensor domain-containing diguanylate cyclase n=1 Tax=Magnetospira sp. (strain QH-2) TaxID=1288970 RepID=UPI00130DC21B|nr:sensor domain-containing diguanylate cyclase [Magnetospira sp. QH-2]